MSTRISSALLLLLLLSPLAISGCGERKTDRSTLPDAAVGQRAAMDDVGIILCSQQGSAFARACTVDRQVGPNGLILTLRHPDGAFHRLLVTKDGRGVVAADGAQRAVVTITGSRSIEVALNGDRYRLPATVGALTLTP